MKKIIALLVLVMAVGLSSCTTKSSAVSDLRNLRDDITNYGYRYDVEDWQKAVNKYQKIDEKLRKYEYTYEESKEIGRLKGECVKGFGQGVIQNLGGKASGLKGQIEGIIEALKGALGNF